MARTTSLRRRWAGTDRGLLVAVIVLVALVLGLAAVIAAIQLKTAADARDRIGQTVELTDLVVGDCVREYRFIVELPEQYTLVDCDLAHAAELVFAEGVGDDFEQYLGERATSELANSICETTARYNLRLDESIAQDYPDAGMRGVYETGASWAEGQNNFYCFLVNTDGSALTGQYFVDQQSEVPLFDESMFEQQ
jgi:hypothetical protein